MPIKDRELVEKKVVCEDLLVGKVKGIIIEPEKWEITHLEVELSEDAAQLVLGIRRGGIRNLLAVSAIGSTGRMINLKVKKGQLKIYLKAPKTES